MTYGSSNISNSTASTTVTDTTANVKDTKYDAMTERMVAMEKMMKEMMVQLGAKDTATSNTTGDGKNGNKTRRSSTHATWAAIATHVVFTQSDPNMTVTRVLGRRRDM